MEGQLGVACNGGSIIASVLEHLKLEDVQLLLENRGMPSIGDKEQLTERLQAALSEEICEFEWEQCEVPAHHVEVTGAGCTMFTHQNSVYAFGGMDDERQEQMTLWKWDLNAHTGFAVVHYRGVIPAKLSAGHYAAVYGNELWVFPMPRNHNMRRVYCLDLLRYRWVERTVTGDPPQETHMRRNLDAVMDGKHLLAVGGQAMDKIYAFSFESRAWTTKQCRKLLPPWTFGHAIRRKRSIFAFGSTQGEFGLLEMRELDLSSLEWRRVDTKGTPPPFKTHSSAAIVAEKWIVHGGRRPGKFNVTNDTSVFDFATLRWSPLMAEGCIPVAREWQGAVGLQDSIVIVAGRVDIPEFEPIPISSDTMCTNIEILWHRPPTNARPPTGKAALMKSVQELYGTAHLADMALLVGGRKLLAHRHVLSPHSPVFERMFMNSMSEANTAQVEILDLEADTVELLLRYCYGCLQKMPSDHCQVIELFKAADKYDVLGLVQECVARFRKLTGAAEVAPLLQVAAERHSQELRSVCIDITANCLPDVLATESFKELTAAQPDLVLDFVRETSIRLGCPSNGPAPKEPPPCSAAPEKPCQSSGPPKSSLTEQLCGRDQHAQAPPTPPRSQPSAMHPQQQQQQQEQPVAIQGTEQALQVDIPRRTNTVSTSGEDSE